MNRMCVRYSFEVIIEQQFDKCKTQDMGEDSHGFPMVLRRKMGLPPGLYDNKLILTLK